MFYGSKFDLIDVPLPRNGLNLDWALLHEESPKNTPVLSHLGALELFNVTATFSRYSHFPLTLQYLKSADDLTGKYTNDLGLIHLFA
jgi:alpha-1,3-fucosyltransferase 10